MEQIRDTAIALIIIAGAAALMRAIAKIAFPSNPEIPPEKRRELEEKYGRWAVELAIAWCPAGDITCIEREAKRLRERLERR